MTDRTSRSLLTPARLSRWGWLMLGGIVVGFVIVVATASGTETLGGGRLGGDWAPFRTAGVLALRDPSLLLDPAAQQAEMAQYLDGGLLPFANPPLFAFLFVPAAWLPFDVGYAIWVFILAVAALVGSRATLDVLGVDDPRWRRVGVLGAMTLAFTMRSYTGAQNATISLLVLAVGFRHLQQGRRWLAGLVFGALWFKPQFAVPLVGLLLVAGHLRATVAATATGGLLWVAHAMVFGTDWTQVWLDGVVRVTDQGNRVFNLAQTASPVEYLRSAVGGVPGDVLGLGLAAVIGLTAAWLAHRHARAPARLLPLACASLLVTALHSLFYEFTLLVPVIGLGLVARGRRGLASATAFWVTAAVVLAIANPLVRIGYLVATVTWAVAPHRQVALIRLS